MGRGKYISLREAGKLCAYSQEYLSLRARQGSLRAVKQGRGWMTTQRWLEEYIRAVSFARPNFHQAHHVHKVSDFSKVEFLMHTRRSAGRIISGPVWIITLLFLTGYALASSSLPGIDVVSDTAMAKYRDAKVVAVSSIVSFQRATQEVSDVITPSSSLSFLGGGAVNIASIFSPFTSGYKNLNTKLTNFFSDTYQKTIETVIPGIATPKPPAEVGSQVVKEITKEVKKVTVVEPIKEITKEVITVDNTKLLSIQGDVNKLQSDILQTQQDLISSQANFNLSTIRLASVESFIVNQNRTNTPSPQSIVQIKYIPDNISALSLELNTKSDRVGLSVNQLGTQDIVQFNDNGTNIFTIQDGGKTTLNTQNSLLTIDTGTATTSLTTPLLTVTGDIAVNGGDLTTTATTFNLLNEPATLNIGSTNVTRTINIGTGTQADTINIGTGGTTADTINIGTGAVANTIAIGSSSATTVSITDNNWSITAAGLITTGDDLAVNGGDITTATTTFSLINTTATTVNFAGAATTLSIGASTGTTTVNNALTVIGAGTFNNTFTNTNGTISNSIFNLTSTGDLVFQDNGVTVLTFTDAGILTVAAQAPTEGQNIFSFTNTAGAGTAYDILDISLTAPTADAGALDTARAIALTIPTPAEANDTIIGLAVVGATATAGTEVAIDIPTITQGAGTETALRIGSGWDTSISAPGTITFSGLTASRFVVTDASSNLAASAASSALLNTLTDETGTGFAVFGTSPDITTSITTGSTTFNLLNTTATTVNFAGAATTISIGASTGTTTINNALTVTGAGTFNNTFTNTNGTTSNSVFNLTSTGDLVFQDAGVTVLTFTDTGILTLAAQAPTEGQNIFAFTNTAGAGTAYDILDISLTAPTADAGALDTARAIALTIPTPAEANDTIIGLAVVGATAGAGTEVAIDIPTITQGAGTETALRIGSGWDTGISTAGNYTQTGTGANTFSGATTFSAAGTALTVNNNAQIASLGIGVAPSGTAGRLTVNENLIVSGVGPHAIGGPTSTANQLTIQGAFTGVTHAFGVRLASDLTVPAGGNGFGIASTPTLIESTSGVDNHAILAGIYVAPTITAGASTATDAAGINIATFAAASGTTNASGLKINAAPTGASSNYALWVAAGLTRLGGNLVLEAGTDIRPTADSTTALNIANAAGTDFVTFDTTNSRVGIGTVSPTQRIESAVASGSSILLLSSWSLTAGHFGTVRFEKSANATIGTRTATVSGESLGGLDFYGVGSDNVLSTSAAFINVEQDGAATAGRVPTRIVFGTSPSANNVAERMRITSGGNVGIGTPGPGARLHVIETSSGTVPTVILDNNVVSNRGSSISFRQSATQKAVVGLSGQVEGDTTADLGLFAETGQGLRFYTGGSAVERAVIDSAGNVGIGTAGPNNRLHAVSETSIQARFGGFGNVNPGIELTRAQGIIGSPSAIGTGQTMGVLDFFGFATDSVYSQGARIEGRATGTIGVGRVPGMLLFHTATDVASPVLTERLRITEAGHITTNGAAAAGPGSYVLTLSGASGANESFGIGFVNPVAGTAGTLGNIGFLNGATQLALVRSLTDGAADSAHLEFHTQATLGSLTERMRITSTGNVGITMPGTQNLVAACHSTDGTAGVATSNFLVDCSGAPSDIAEWYDTTPDVDIGDIVTASSQTMQFQSVSGIGTVIDKDGHQTDGVPLPGATATISVLQKSTQPYQSNIIGIVSTAPYQTFGEDVKESAQHPQKIALTGRVPVKVSLENGPIKPGDRITSSSIPGIGMRATESGPTIGIALEEFSISNFQFSNNDSNSNDQNTIGKILIFVNLGYSKLTVENGLDPNAPTPLTLESLAIRVDIIEQRVLALELKLDSSGSVTQDSNSPTPPLIVRGGDGGGVTSPAGFLASLQSAFETLGAKLADGILTIKEVVTSKLTIGTSQEPSGITLYDENTGEPYCLKIKGGEVTSTLGKCGDTDTTDTTDTGQNSPSPEHTTTALEDTTIEANATTTEDTAGQSATTTTNQ